MTTLPWSNQVSLNLDFMYLSNNSERTVAPIITNSLVDNVLTQSNLDKIIEIIETLFSQKWNKLYETYSLTYNPIHNYNIEDTVTRTSNLNLDRTSTSSTNDTVENTLNSTVKNTNVTSLSGSNENDVYGFNSTEVVHNTKDTDSNLTNSEDNVTKADTSNVTSNSTMNSSSGVDSTKTESVTEHKSGNIGVTTTQKLVESELSIWQNYKLYNTIFNDLNSILTLSIYE